MVMNKLKITFLIIVAVLMNSCEKVVDIKLNTGKPKLVIEASINWQKGTDGKDQKVKLSTTTDFYTNAIPVVSGATVSIKNSQNTVFEFIEKPNTGEYFCTNFVSVLNETYTLTVVNKGETYTAIEKLIPVAPIDHIEQNNQGGIGNKSIELKSYYFDPANELNSYMFQYSYPNKLTPDFYVGNDTFYDGNIFFSLSRYDKIKVGDKIEISHFGISKTYENYMIILMNIASNSGGSPFQTPPSTVRGNIINKTNFDNYALGYFRVSEVDKQFYTVQ